MISRSRSASGGSQGAAHRFKELFGYQALNAQRRERVEQLMAEAIEARYDKAIVSFLEPT